MPPHLEFLSSRLQSFDTRTYYVRFGHHVITMCTWCMSYRDYLFYYLVNVSLEYLRTAMLVTVMTMKGSGKRRWRKWTLAAVFGALVTEGWAVSLMDMVIPRVGTECEMVGFLVFTHTTPSVHANVFLSKRPFAFTW